MKNLLDHGSIWLEHKDYPGYLFCPEGKALQLKPTFRLVTERFGKAKRYLQWRIKKNNKWSYPNAHRIIAEIFVHNPDSKPCVNHLNGNKLDSRSENLEWVTHKENAVHSFKVLGNIGLKGEKNPMSKLTENIVNSIREDLKVCKYGDQVKLAAKYKTTPAMISVIKSGKVWAHLIKPTGG